MHSKMFSSASGRPARTVQSAGWACPIVKHIVNLHGGTIAVDSDGLGMGSVFIIRLPLPVIAAGFASPARADILP